jgi:hypothetical protein
VSLAGWINRHQQHLVEYLVEENRVLREQLKGQRICLNDDQRRLSDAPVPTAHGEGKGRRRPAPHRVRRSGRFAEAVVNVRDERRQVGVGRLDGGDAAQTVNGHPIFPTSGH